ncbi:phosphotransferase [Nocardioides ferulae]|uniref:phosphotransferase n=1 Tax=Nocardioides ferulae TaxID=2340821 RepID=UPI000EADD512|nr:phosphotransferase [Nocardioides ferulae]
MWQPEAAWEPVPGGTGPSTVGVWRYESGGRGYVVKRLEPPRPGDPHELADPHHSAYWRRAADVARSGAVTDTPGLRAPHVEVQEDAEGVTLVQPEVDAASNGGLFVAHNLARFAGADLGDVPWLAGDQLRQRLARTERLGGWPTLARTTVADLAFRIWERRPVLMAALDALPQVPQHGDPVPDNLRGRLGDDVLAIDWSTVGTGPVGADLGYWALSAREEYDPLVDAYCGGLPPGVADREQVLLGARITTVYTVLSRAEWALARAAMGEGALAGKYRHPAVAPHLRALQRHFPQIESLLG